MKLYQKGFYLTKIKNRFSDGTTITWELSSNKDAQSILEERAESQSSSSTVQEQSTSSRSSSVDTKNLTSAQLEHWVREVIKSGSQVYNASDYTFTQSFVDGYAEIFEWIVNSTTNKKEILATYRVNGSGELEVKNDNSNGDWVLVSSSYQ